MPNTGSIIYLVLLFAVFYFMLIRPQQQRSKKHQALMNDLKENDPVVTIGGLHGTITKIKDKTIILKVADNVKLEVLKSAVAYKSEEAGLEKP